MRDLGLFISVVTPIWELRLTNFSLDIKIYESLAKLIVSHDRRVINDIFFSYLLS